MKKVDNLVKYITDVVLPSEKSVCVFTTHKKYENNLDLRDDGISKSGIWKLNMSKMDGIKKVIIYYRHDNINEIIVGDYLKLSKSDVSSRYYLYFKVLGKCQTLNNWKDFCKTGSYPVKYT